MDSLPAIPPSLLEEDGTKWYCYLLRNTQFQYSHLTYNGSTNDLRRRLRQHNEEIVGGARYTHGRGGGWEYYALLTGFPDHKNALSCEWRIKHSNGKPGKRPKEHCGMTGRIVSLNEILKLERWTKQCTHENKNHQFTLYVADDVVHYLDISGLPTNVVFGGGILSSLIQEKKSTTKCNVNQTMPGVKHPLSLVVEGLRPSDQNDAPLT